MHFTGIEHHKVAFAEDDGFFLRPLRQESDVFIRQPVGIRRAGGKDAKGHALLAFEYNLDVEIAGVIFGAAVGHRLGGIFGNEIEQVVAVNIMFTQRRRVGDMRFNMFDRLT